MRGHRSRHVLAAVGVLLLVSACSAAGRQYDLRIGSVDLRVEVADTDSSRAHGLMERESLGEREGMLFVFDSSESRTFWMKNTLIPLSIAYIDDNLVIREILDMQPESLEPIPSREPARYALEVNQGAFERLGIRVGTRLVPSAALSRRIGR